MNKKNNNAPWANMKLITSIKESHYKWCLDNGRDTSWYYKLKNIKNYKDLQKNE
jgi:hypothetical protein